MHSSKAMQAFMTRLIERYNDWFIADAGEKRLYLQREGLPTLGVVASDCTVSVSLEEMWDGEPYLKPEVLFYTATREWTPIYSSRPTATTRGLAAQMATWFRLSAPRKRKPPKLAFVTCGRKNSRTKVG